MINTNVIVNIKTTDDGKDIEFTYSREDKINPEDKNEKYLLVYVEQLVRGMIDNGFYLNDLKKDMKDGK